MELITILASKSIHGDQKDFRLYVKKCVKSTEIHTYKKQCEFQSFSDTKLKIFSVFVDGFRWMMASWKRYELHFIRENSQKALYRLFSKLHVFHVKRSPTHPNRNLICMFSWGTFDLKKHCAGDPMSKSLNFTNSTSSKFSGVDFLINSSLFWIS